MSSTPTYLPLELAELRRKLLALEQERQGHLDVLIEAGPMIVGSFMTVRRTCGQPACRTCARGDKHERRYLSRSHKGRTKMLYVRVADEEAVAIKAAQYRRYRKARAALRTLARQVTEAADALQQALVEPYPRPEDDEVAPS